MPAYLGLYLLYSSAFLLVGHPVPRDNRDRTLIVRLTPTGVRVDYRLEIDELSVAQELPADVIRTVESRNQLHAVASRFLGPVLAENVVVQLDDRIIPLRCSSSRYQVSDHLRIDYQFEGDWKLEGPGRHRFVCIETNWDQDEASQLRVRLAATDLKLSSLEAPSEELIERKPIDRRPGDTDHLRRLSAILQRNSTIPAGVYKPGLPPELILPRGGPESIPAAILFSPPSEGTTVSQSKEDGGILQSNDPGKVRNPETQTNPENRHSGELLELLLDSRTGLFMLLILAALFGAAHAVTPGHGKTLVAAYLIGERGTVWHAMLLGVVVTLTHTSSVLLIALLLPWLFPGARAADVQIGLELIGGLLIAGLGFWLLLTRLSGQADHVHLGGGHHHHHQEPNGSLTISPGWKGLILLGISGGIVPCWDAILMLGFAISAGRMWLGVPLLLAFSTGLAGVLVAIGIGVVATKNILVRWIGTDTPTMNRLAHILPLLSALLIALLGFWLCYDVSRVWQSSH